jgi:hypothetical protein
LSALAEGKPSLKVSASVLFGAPGESLSTIEYAIRYIREYAAKGIEFYYNVGLRLYPGTPLFNDWSQGRLDSRLCYGPGRFDDGQSPLIYCAPGSPRIVARRIADAVSHFANVRSIAISRSANDDETLRLLHVATASWHRGNVIAASRILGGLGIRTTEGTDFESAILGTERRLRGHILPEV